MTASDERARSVCTACSAPPGVLPQAAERLDTRRELWPDEVRVRVERLNLDAASFRQLERTHDGDGDAVRAAVLDIVATRGKMQNPETGSGGMLVGTVEEVGPESPLGLAVGDRVATLVSLTLTPLVIEDGLARWDGRSEQVPADGYAVLFGRSIAAVIPDDLPAELSLSVMDVCGAPALTARVVGEYATARSRSWRRGRAAPASRGRCPWPPPGPRGPPAPSASCRTRPRPTCSTRGRARRRGRRGRRPRPGGALARPSTAAGGPADVTVVCVDVPGCEGGAVLSTARPAAPSSSSRWPPRSAPPRSAPRGWPPTCTMLVGNGYVPGHADLALPLLRGHAGRPPAVRAAPGSGCRACCHDEP